MAGRRRGRSGRGWDAAPPRAARTARSSDEARPRPRQGPDGGSTTAADPRDPAEAAREICLRQLAVRPRTRAELAATLRRHGVADPVAAEVLDRYAEVGMIDDAAFARAWVASRHHGRGLARRALGSELRQRGVPAEAVGEALRQLAPDAEARKARELVDRKLRTTGGDPAGVVRRLVGMLARKGYPPALAFRVVKEALAEDARTAALAEQIDPDALADAASADDTNADETG